MRLSYRPKSAVINIVSCDYLALGSGEMNVQTPFTIRAGSDLREYCNIALSITILKVLKCFLLGRRETILRLKKVHETYKVQGTDL